MADFLNVEFTKDCPGSSVIATEPMLGSYIMTPKDGDEDSKNLMYIENLSSINNLYSTSSGLSIENDLQEVSMVPRNGVVPNSLIQFLPNGDQEVTELEDSSQLLKNDSPYYSYLRLPPSSSAQDDHEIQIYTTTTNSTQSASQEKNELSDEMILRFVNNPKSLKQQKSPPTAATAKPKINNSSTYDEEEVDVDDENFDDDDSVSNTNNLGYGEDGPDEVGDYINHEQPSCSTRQLDDELETTTTTKKQQQVVIVTQDSAVKSSSPSSTSKSPPRHSIEDQQQVGGKSPESDEQVEFEIVTVDLLLSDEANLEEETELEAVEQTVSKTAPLRIEISSRRKKTNICVNRKQHTETEANQTAATKPSPQYSSSKVGKRKNLLTDMQNEAESPRAKKQRRIIPIETVEKPFKCSKCHLKFAEEDIFELHEKCHIEGGKSFHCCYANCKVKFPNWVKMYHHLFKHGLRKPYKCNECSFTCISRSDLTTHGYVHAQVKSWKCDKCRRTFKHRRNLLAHQRQCCGLSSSGKPLVDENIKYKCPDCDKQLANKRNLDKHREIHTNVKPFVCQICGHSTRLKESLIMHKRLHTGEKPFKCDKCEYSTPDKSSLRRHKRRHNNDKPYKCDQCDYSCIQKHCLDTHIRRAHTGEQFMCEFCRYVTPNRYALNQHRKRHNIKLYHANGNGGQPVLRCISDVIPSFSNVDNTTTSEGSGGKPVVIQLDVDQSTPTPYRSSRKIRSDGQQVSQSSNKSINELVEEGAQQQEQESSTTPQNQIKAHEDETVIVVSDNYDIVTNEDDGSQDFVLSTEDVAYIAAQLEKQQDDPTQFKNNGDPQEVWLPRRDGRMIVIQFGGTAEDEQPSTTAPSTSNNSSSYQLTYQQKRS